MFSTINVLGRWPSADRDSADQLAAHHAGVPELLLSVGPRYAKLSPLRK